MSTLPAIDTASALETLLNSVRSIATCTPACWWSMQYAGAKGCWLTMARWSHIPANTPDVHLKDKFTVKDPITAELVNWGDHQPAV